MNLHRVHMVKMRADALAIHPTAQREIQPGWLKILTNKMDLDAIGTIDAVRYPINGKPGPWVVDGQHRILALLNLGCGDWEVDVKIHLDVKSDKRASELFKKLNTRRTVAPFDMYQQEVLAGEESATGVDDIVRKHGLRVGKKSADGIVACPATAKKAYRLDSGRALDRSIGISTSAFGKKAAALEGNLIYGIALVAATHNGDLDEPALVKKLAKYPGGASAIIGDAKGRMQFHRGSLSRSTAAIVVDAYNVGRRSGRLDPI